jgi:hypothetical protein
MAMRSGANIRMISALMIRCCVTFDVRTSEMPHAQLSGQELIGEVLEAMR